MRMKRITMNMITKVRGTVERRGLIPPGAAVLCAVSGGADSVTLLHILRRLQAEIPFTLAAAHINHGLRGEEAQRDEDFVRTLCHEWDVPLSVLQADIRALAAESGESEEECGRRVRYDYFAALDANAYIATAHTLSDRVETFLFHFARGTSPHGLCAIPAKRGQIIRPLLDCTRAEVERYCKEEGLSFVTDSSNADCAYSRNRIRHRVVPQLQALNPELARAALRCFSALEAQDDYLQTQATALCVAAKKEDGHDAAQLLAAHPALRNTALAQLMRAQGTQPDFAALKAAEALLQTGGVRPLHGGVSMVVKDGVLRIAPQNRSAEMGSWRVDFALGIVGTPAGTLEIMEVYSPFLNMSQKIHKQSLAFEVDCDKIKGNAHLRSRLPGDEIRLAGRGCTKTLKKLFQEQGVLPRRRNETVILADDEGVVWVQGFGCAQRCLADAQTRRLLQITMRE